MNKPQNLKSNLYFTQDHEWIDFQGSVAYVGVSPFKLKGIFMVHQLTLSKNTGHKRKGDVIATIHYEDYEIPVHMPVDGKVVSINDEVLEYNTTILLDQRNKNGWIALIAPNQPYERFGLIPQDKYNDLINRDFKKSENGFVNNSNLP